MQIEKTTLSAFVPKEYQNEIGYRKNIRIAVICIGMILGTGVLLAAFAFPITSVSFYATLLCGVACYGISAIVFYRLKLKPKTANKVLMNPEEEKPSSNLEEERLFKIGIKVHFPFSCLLSNTEKATCKICIDILKIIFLNNLKNLKISFSVTKQIMSDSTLYETLLNALKMIRLSVNSDKLNLTNSLYEEDGGAGEEILKRTAFFLSWMISQSPKEAKLVKLKEACIA